jgi:hypothetical protein
MPFMLREYKLSPITIFGAITMIAVVEAAAGTTLLFLGTVALTLIFVAITYNLLGGVSTISGILFAAFALRTIVISQLGKVILFEPADGNLETPALTISMYALFYFSVMVGVFLYARVRLGLVRPLEPLSAVHSHRLYTIAVVVGGIGTAVFQSFNLDPNNQEYNNVRSAGLAFSGLLLFAVVVAVDSRIRDTGGRHSFGWSVLIPCSINWISAFLQTSRGVFLTPVVAYFATCYMRGYRFKRRHYAMALAMSVFFLAIYSPFELYSRSVLGGRDVRDRIGMAFQLIFAPPTKSDLESLAEHDVQQDPRSEYFDRAGFTVLNRFSLIRPDSNLISACSNGYHYGFTTMKIDILANVPRFLYPGKPNEDSAGFVGRVSGMNGDFVENGEIATSPIAESYGCFGWPGVAVFGFCVFPLLFVVCESVFDVSRPWGTVAIGMLLPNFGEDGFGTYLVRLIRLPAYLVLLSWLVGGIAQMLPARGDNDLYQEEESMTPGPTNPIEHKLPQSAL